MFAGQLIHNPSKNYYGYLKSYKSVETTFTVL